MIELVGAHGLDDAEIVDVLFQMWQPVGHPLAAFTRLVKGKLRPQQLGHAADEGKALAAKKDAGQSWPSSLVNSGLCSKSSNWLGAPAMCR